VDELGQTKPVSGIERRIIRISFYRTFRGREAKSTLLHQICLQAVKDVQEYHIE